MSRILRNSLAAAVASAINTTLAFLLVPRMLLLLGGERYGVWVLTFAVIGALSFLQYALETALVRQVVRASGAAGLASAIRAGFWIYFLLGGAGTLFLVVFTPRIAVFVTLAPELLPELVYCLRVAGCMILFKSLSAWSMGVLKGREDYVWPAVLQAVFFVGSYGGGWGVLHFGYSLRISVFVALITSVLVCVCGIVLVLRMTELRLFLPCSKDAVELLQFGAPFLAITGVTSLTAHVDRLLLGGIRSVNAVPMYSIPLRISSAVAELCLVLFHALYPRLVALLQSAHSDADEASGLIGIATRFQLSLAGPLFVACAVAGPPFIRNWIGESFAGETAVCLLILCATGVATIGRALACARISTEQRLMRIFCVATIGYAVVSLVAATLLARRYGHTGIALGYCFGEWFYTGVTLAIVRFGCRTRGRSPVRLIVLWGAMNLGILLAIVMVKPLWFVPMSYPLVMVAGAGTFIVAVLVHAAVGILPFTEVMVLWRRACMKSR
jgi:O-antigen/teichoic acid export membrane protein